MSSTHKLTDMGWPEEEALWRYTLLSEPLLSSELARLSFASSIADTHSVTFQPCPNPEYANQDRLIVQDWPLPNGFWSFRAVFDGHAGHDTANYAVQRLPEIIREQLVSVLASDNEPSPSAISNVLSSGIALFDNQIVGDLLTLFPDADAIAKLSDDEISSIINDSHSGGTNSAIVRRCMRGSTVLISLTDPSKSNLWVASLGDCQAVLGTKLPSGQWETVVLSSFHNGQNQAEVARIKQEHPGEEECVLNNRVLGAIAVTRAVGDHLFKLPSVYTHRIFTNAKPGFSFSTKVEDFLGRNLTPPYLANQADVRHIHLQSTEKSASFLIMCSDGLMDLYEDAGMELADVWVDILGKIETSHNPALALLRDALGGEDEERVSRMMTVEMGFRWMDDTTIAVQSL